MTTRSMTGEKDSLHARATRKVMLHLLPVMFAIYFMSYIDRTNVALAKTPWAQPVVAFDLDDSVGQDARRACDVDVG